MEQASITEDDQGTVYDLQAAPTYEVTFLPEPGKKPLRVVIELGDSDFLEKYTRWHATRGTAGWDEDFLHAEVYPEAARLVVSWNSKQVPCTPENKLARLSGVSGLRLLYLASRLTAGKELAPGDLMISKVSSVTLLQ